MQLIRAKIIHSLLRHDCDAEFHCIKHHILRVGKKGTVIRKSYKSCNFQLFSADRKTVSDCQIVIVRIHTVNRNFILLLRHFPLHQTDKIDIRPVLENTQRTFYLFGLLLDVPVGIDCYLPLLFQLLQQLRFRLRRQFKVAVLNVIFFKALIIRCRHAAGCHQKAGRCTDHPEQEKEDDQIFSNLIPKIPRESFM